MIVSNTQQMTASYDYSEALPNEIIASVFEIVLREDQSLKSVFCVNKKFLDIAKSCFYGSTPCCRPMKITFAFDFTKFHTKVNIPRLNLQCLDLYSKYFDLQSFYNRMSITLNSDDLSLWKELFIDLNLSIDKNNVNQLVNGSTLLFKVCRHIAEDAIKNYEMIERLICELLLKQADPNIESTKEKRLPLVYLVSISPSGEKVSIICKVVKILVLHGADPYKKSNGTDALKAAKKYIPIALPFMEKSVNH